MKDVPLMVPVAAPLFAVLDVGLLARTQQKLALVACLQERMLTNEKIQIASNNNIFYLR